MTGTASSARRPRLRPGSGRLRSGGDRSALRHALAVAALAAPVMLLGAGSAAWDAGLARAVTVVAGVSAACAGVMWLGRWWSALSAVVALVTAFGTGVQDRLLDTAPGVSSIVPTAAMTVGVALGAALARRLITAPRRARALLALLLAVAGVGLRLAPVVSGVPRTGALALAGASVHVGEVARVLVVASVAALLADGSRLSGRVLLRQISRARAVARLAVAGWPSLLVLVAMAVMHDLGPAVVLAVAVAAVLYRAVGPGLAGIPLGAVVVATALVGSTSRELVKRFQDVLSPQESGSDQLGRALRAEGLTGLIGGGPGSGGLVGSIPARYSDYLPAVVAADHGLLVMLAVLGLLAAVTAGLLAQARPLTGVAALLATGGAVLLLVPVLWTGAGNLGLIPLTGLDVPFLAANGSSTLAAGLAFGLCLGALGSPASATVVLSATRSGAVPGRHLSTAGRVAAVVVLAVGAAQSVRLTATAGGGHLPGETNLRPVGALVTWDGDTIAERAPAQGPRRYPAGDLYADLGWRVPLSSSEGIEWAAAGALTCGHHHGMLGRLLRAGLTEECEPADVVSTVNGQLQRRLVREVHANPATTAVVLDARTGAVLAAASDLSAGSREDRRWTLNRAGHTSAAAQIPEGNRRPPVLALQPFTRQLPPGSTFKIVTATAGLLAGLAPPPLGDRYTPAEGTTIRNAWLGPCPAGRYQTMLAYSCNTSASWTAVEAGPARLEEAAHRFGIGSRPQILGPPDPTTPDTSIPWRLPAATIGLDGRSPAPDVMARTGIGQEGVRMTVFDVAMMTAVVARRGTAVDPRIIAGTCDGSSLRPWTPPARPAPAPSPAVARALDAVHEGMREAVRTGTAKDLANASGQVAAKTGTAETTLAGRPAAISWVTVIVDDATVLTVAVEPTAGRLQPAAGQRAIDVAGRLLPHVRTAARPSPATIACGRR